MVADGVTETGDLHGGTSRVGVSHGRVLTDGFSRTGFFAVRTEHEPTRRDRRSVPAPEELGGDALSGDSMPRTVHGE